MSSAEKKVEFSFLGYDGLEAKFDLAYYLCHGYAIPREYNPAIETCFNCPIDVDGLTYNAGVLGLFCISVSLLFYFL